MILINFLLFACELSIARRELQEVCQSFYSGFLLTFIKLSKSNYLFKKFIQKTYKCVIIIKRGGLMKIYNKLVRDKIPAIIAADNGKTCKTRIMEDEEYLESLNTKMQEELKEYLESGDVEELADLEEVLRAILDVKKVSYEEFEKIRNAKVEKRGAFKEKIFLESVSEPNDK